MVKRFTGFLSVLLSAAIFLRVPLSASSIELDDIRRQQAQKKAKDREAQQLRKKLAAQERKLQAEQASREELQTEVSALNREILFRSQKIVDMEREIAALEEQLAETRQRAKEEFLNLQQAVRELDTAGVSFAYLFEMLQYTTDVIDVDECMHLLKYISTHFQKLIQKINDTAAEIEQQRNEIDARLASLVEQKNLLEAQKRAMTGKIDSLAKEIDAVQEEQQLTKEQIEENAEARAKQEADIDCLLKKWEQQEAERREAERARKEAERKAREAARLAEWEAKVAEAKAKGETLPDRPPDDAPEVEGRWVWPVPASHRITSHFGPRWGTLHKGVDVGAPKGTAVVAPQSGTVTFVSASCTHDQPKTHSCGCAGGFGNLVVISHDNGERTYLGHLSTVSVVLGQHVEAGELIGGVGCTGHSTGNHLHYGAWRDGAFYNPMTRHQ